MSTDYLTTIAERLLGLMPAIRPRLASRYEPAPAIGPAGSPPVDDGPPTVPRTTEPGAERSAFDEPTVRGEPAGARAESRPRSMTRHHARDVEHTESVATLSGEASSPGPESTGEPATPMRPPPPGSVAERIATSTSGIATTTMPEAADRTHDHVDVPLPADLPDAVRVVATLPPEPDGPRRPTAPLRGSTTAVTSSPGDGSPPTAAVDATASRPSQSRPHEVAGTPSRGRIEVVPVVDRSAESSTTPDLETRSLDRPGDPPAPNGHRPAAALETAAVLDAPLVLDTPAAHGRVAHDARTAIPLSGRAAVTVAATRVPAWRDVPPDVDRTSSSRERDQATDRDPPIHVTIGRVEIRAVASASPAHRSHRRSPAMGLDEYLRRNTHRGTP